MGSIDGIEGGEVPIIDFSAWVRDDSTDEERQRAAQKLVDAFTNVGFLYLSQHGISDDLVNQTFDWSAKLFDLPSETKMLAPHPPDGAYHRGYSGVGKEKVGQIDPTKEKGVLTSRKVPDVKESFEIGNEKDDKYANIWLPEDKLPRFKSSMTSFYTQMSHLARQLHIALATGLNLPDKEHLLKAHTQERYQLRLLHYPPVPMQELRNGVKERIAAHTDFGTFTLLFQDSIGGLEVSSPSRPDIFIPVKPIPGTIVVNVGDMLQRWTNDRFRSTMHRVRAPPRSEEEPAMTKARYSIPFFISADDGTIVQCLPGCEGETGPKYEPVDCREWIEARLRATY